MKTCTAIMIGLLLIEISTFAQGIASFSAVLDPAHAVPPNSSLRTGRGGFTLDSSRLFSGVVAIPEYGGITSVSIFRAVSASDVGVRLFELNPGPISIGIGGTGDGQYFDVERMLTDVEANDLQSGLWWATVVTPEFANGEIRGQITAVPEPSRYAMFGCGMVMLAVFHVRRAKNPLVVRHRSELTIATKFLPFLKLSESRWLSCQDGN